MAQIVGSSKQKDIIALATIAETAERYDDMVVFMSEAAKLGKFNGEVHRNLFSVAFKNAVSVRRSAWRVVNQKLQEEDTKANQAVYNRAKTLLDNIQNEIEGYCVKVIEIVDEHILKDVVDEEEEVFYIKMKADYCRYQAELGLEEPKKKASEFYKAAQEKAEKNLEPTNPTLLGLALNYSVFCHELANKPDLATSTAKMAFDNAIAKLDKLEESNYKDSTLIMQLLRDNLTLWSAGDQSQIQED